MTTSPADQAFTLSSTSLNVRGMVQRNVVGGVACGSASSIPSELKRTQVQSLLSDTMLENAHLRNVELASSTTPTRRDQMIPIAAESRSVAFSFLPDIDGSKFLWLIRTFKSADSSLPGSFPHSACKSLGLQGPKPRRYQFS